MSIEVKNAVIKSTSLGDLGRGFTFSISITTKDWAVGFGGWKSHIENSIKRILETLEIDQWEKLPGIPCRVDIDSGTGEVCSIGHFYKNKWWKASDRNED